MNKDEYNAFIKQLALVLDSLPPRRTDTLLERRILQALNRAVFLRDKLVPEVTQADPVREVELTYGIRDRKLNGWVDGEARS